MFSANELVAQGLRHHRAGDLEAAERQYRAALDQSPQHADAWNSLGLLVCQQGRHQLGLGYIEHALEVRPADPGFLLNHGVALQGLDRTAEAAESFSTALAVQPNFPEAHNNLGNALYTLGRHAEALEHWRQAASLRPNFAEPHRNLAFALLAQSQAAAALDHARQAARLQPGSVPGLMTLGDALATLGQHAEAADAYGAALRLRPDLAEVHRRLAHVLRLSSRPADALAEAGVALRLRPDDPDAHNEAAAALGMLGRPGEAEAHARQALQLRPGDPEASHNLAVLLTARRCFAEAADLDRQALRSRPELTAASLNLARTLTRQGQLDEAEDVLRQALARKPDHAPTHTGLAEVLAGQGRLDESQTAFREALRLNPSLNVAHSSLLLALSLDPRPTRAELLADHRRFEERFAGIIGTPPAYAGGSHGGSSPDRPLRVGYVSPDLIGHVVVNYFGPVLAHHDRRHVEAICYADVLTPDAVTERLRALAAGWQGIHGWSDDEVACQVREDRIDVLVDLAGHTGNRLGVFARRPAPVQLTWLGYPETTGLSAIAYRLTDAIIHPPDEVPFSVEEPIRLPGCFCCFMPAADAPPVAPSPCQSRGHVTFGSLHKLAKLNDAVLDTWSAVIRAVPGSRLLICRDALHGRAAESLRERLIHRGLNESQFELSRPPSRSPNHLGVYADIDILLDAWPWSGHATACEALWQGVPVVTLRGERPAGRMVASVLQTVGLGELVAETADDFVARAAALAADMEKVAAMRDGLRETVRGSPLCDAASFTRRLEDVYRQSWTRWGSEPC